MEIASEREITARCNGMHGQLEVSTSVMHVVFHMLSLPMNVDNKYYS